MALYDRSEIFSLITEMGKKAREDYDASVRKWAIAAGDARSIRGADAELSYCEYWKGYMMAMRDVLLLMEFDVDAYQDRLSNDEKMMKLYHQTGLHTRYHLPIEAALFHHRYDKLYGEKDD